MYSLFGLVILHHHLFVKNYENNLWHVYKLPLVISISSPIVY